MMKRRRWRRNRGRYRGGYLERKKEREIQKERQENCRLARTRASAGGWASGDCMHAVGG
jgi:hypothetical protein